MQENEDEHIIRWLSEASWSRRILNGDHSQQRSDTKVMSRRSPTVSPASENIAATTSRGSEQKTAKIYDSDYRTDLVRYGIFIEVEDPPSELMVQAKSIVSRRCRSPELDNCKAEQVRKDLRGLHDCGQRELASYLMSTIIPSMDEPLASWLTQKSDLLSRSSVPIPFQPDHNFVPHPLPLPKLDLTFGFSENAFTREQLTTMDLFIDVIAGQDFAILANNIDFPFLTVEFKDQASGGTHFIASNQGAVAGAGAIALNGFLELMRRSFGIKDIESTEIIDNSNPAYFSVTMDHTFAQIFVHWVSPPVERCPSYGLHVELLSQHILREATSLRAFRCSFKNIVDFAGGTHLQKICHGLDAYQTTDRAARLR